MISNRDRHIPNPNQQTSMPNRPISKPNREALREYVKWMRPKGDVNLYFLLGHDDKGHILDANLKKEHARYGDIIVGDFQGYFLLF